MPLLVSVIIPTYNGDRFIAEAIESVLNQTYPQVELIVVDDGSTDSTLTVLQNYGDRIRWECQPHQGVAIARNRGWQMAQGEWIAFLDQDDVFWPDKLALQVACLETHPKIGMLHSGWQRIDDRGQPLGTVEPWHQAATLNLQEWLWWKPVLLSAMMFRRSWLERSQGLDPAFQQVCDLDLVLRLSQMGCETTWLRQITVGYREHDRNDSRNTRLQAQEHEQVLDKFFAMPNLPDAIRQIEQRCRYHTLVWSAWRLYSTNHYGAMADYLEKSLGYTPYLLTETIADWMNSFSTYASEQNLLFDATDLTESIAWQKLLQKCLLQP